MDLAKEFKKYSRSHAFFYVTLDPERALGIEDILPNYTIICPYKSQLTERLHVLVLEERLSSKDVGKIVERGTYGILRSDFVQKYIHANAAHRKSHIMVLKNSQLIEDLCKKQKWNLLAPKAKIAEKFENKISQYKLLKNVVPYPKSFIATIEEVYKNDKDASYFCSTQGGDLFNPPIAKANDSPLKSQKQFASLSLPGMLVLQFNRGHSGNSTFFVKSKKELKTLHKLYPKRECKISQYIKGKTYTLNCLVLKSGAVITGSLSEQITGVKAATSNPNTTCGNDFSSPRTLSKASVKKIQEIAKKTGNVLREKGYKGLFGIDVIIEAKSTKVYFIELNTHQPASISFEAKFHRKIGKVPLLAHFILDSIRPLSSPYEEEVRRGRPPIILPISARQIIYRNKTSRVLNRKDVERRYKGKGLVSRMKFIKQNEEIYRIQHGL